MKKKRLNTLRQSYLRAHLVLNNGASYFCPKAV